MDAEELIKEIKHQRNLLKEYKARLRKNEIQIAALGELYVPEHKLVNKDKLEAQIQESDRKTKQLKNQAIAIKQNEVDAFQHMLQVLSNDAATEWIFSTIYRPLTVGLETMSGNTIDEIHDMIVGKVSLLCNERMVHLKQDISNIQNM